MWEGDPEGLPGQGHGRGAAHGALPPQPSAPRRRASPIAPRPAPEAPAVVSATTRPDRPGVCSENQIFIVQGGPPAHDCFVGFVGDSRRLTLWRTAGLETKSNRSRNATRQTGKVGSILLRMCSVFSGPRRITARRVRPPQIMSDSAVSVVDEAFPFRHGGCLQPRHWVASCPEATLSTVTHPPGLFCYRSTRSVP